MDNVFILHPDATKLDLQDAIDERVMQLSGLAECLLVSYSMEKNLDYNVIHNTLWLLRDQLEEISYLRDKMIGKA